MSKYDGMRLFADSWMLVAMFLFFLYVVVRAFLPRLRDSQKDAADSIFRNENRPAPEREEA